MADKIARSVEMEDAEYFLALWRHQHADTLPPVLGTRTLRQAISVFFNSCGDGRDEEHFLRVFNAGMGTFRRALPDCKGMKPRQRATLARAANRSLAELWNSLRERCRLFSLPAMGRPAEQGAIRTNQPSSEQVHAPDTAARAGEPNLGSTEGAAHPPEPADNRNWTLRLIADRRGQTAFRNDLFERFDGKCVVTGCDLADVLEAAHIKPYAGEPDDQKPDNGLLLRADIHTLFDLHLIGIDPDGLVVRWHPRLKVSSTYRPFAVRPHNIRSPIGNMLPTPNGQRPRAAALEERYRLFCEQGGLS